MVLTALRGALGFLTRVPVGRDPASWEAFRSTPASFPLTGYALGALLAVPYFLPLADVTIAFGFVVWLYLVTGITHLDGLADLGDAVVVHGGIDRRRAVLKDSAVGVGGTLSMVLLIAGLLLVGIELAALSAVEAIVLLVMGEVGAKVTMAVLVCVGTSPYEGLGEQLTARSSPSDVLLPIALALPAFALAWPGGPMVLGSIVAVAFGSLLLARSAVGGVTGDVLGAANEVSRLVALHVGVIGWTLS